MLPRENRPRGRATASSPARRGAEKGVEAMQQLTVIRDYAWLKLMDVLCWFRGHACGEFPMGRYCRRCYRVEGVDFRSQPQQPTSAIGRLVRGRKE